MTRSIAILALLLGSLAAPALAGDVSLSDDGVVTWHSRLDPIEIEWKAGGVISRIVARITATVAPVDPQGIRDAQALSEAEARASLADFLRRTKADPDILAEIVADIEAALAARPAARATTRTDGALGARALAEISEAFAAGALDGRVVVLLRGFDQLLDEAWVEVGLTERVMSRARPSG